MRRLTVRGFAILPLLRLISAVALLTTSAILSWADPCVTGTAPCTEWLSVPTNPSRLLIYRSHPLRIRNEQITTALIVVHGTNRNATDYFRSGVAAGFLAGALERTVVIAPRFGSWYQPSMPATRCRHYPYPSASTRTTFDTWPYGLKNGIAYVAAISDEQLKKELIARPATYLLGDNDILSVGGFDVSCPLMAQGPTRLARGLAFHKNVSERFAARHNVVIVPRCGHSNRCMYTSISRRQSCSRS